MDGKINFEAITSWSSRLEIYSYSSHCGNGIWGSCIAILTGPLVFPVMKKFVDITIFKLSTVIH